MSQMMKLRITGGPSMISMKVTDIETGRVLPVTEFRFGYDQQGHLAAKVTILIHEVDVNMEVETEVEEEIQPIRPEWAESIAKIDGTIVRDPREAQ